MIGRRDLLGIRPENAGSAYLNWEIMVEARKQGNRAMRHQYWLDLVKAASWYSTIIDSQS